MSLQATAVATGWLRASERRVGAECIGAWRRAPALPAANREGVSGSLRHLHSGILPSSFLRSTRRAAFSTASQYSRIAPIRF